MLPKLLWKRLAFLCTYLVLGLTVAFASTSLFASAYAQTGLNQPFKAKVFVITTFSTEAQLWLNHQTWPLTFMTPLGGDDHQVVHCNNKGVCLTIIGVDKVNAAASMTAILRDPQLLFDKNSYFLLAGTASTSPYGEGTLGFTAWARWVVDWDQGLHLFPATVPGIPYGYIAPNTTYSDSTAVFDLNEDLVQQAYKVTSHVQLQDSDAAIAERRKYPGQDNQHPFVSVCDTITGDNIWAGTLQAKEAQYITSKLTKGAGKNCTAAQEDTAVAGVLKRFGYLDHFLSLRGASAFDQPYPGQSLQKFVENSSPFRANDIATENLYRVGSTMVNYLVQSQTN
jgi:purine nucleoside permease